MHHLKKFINEVLWRQEVTGGYSLFSDAVRNSANRASNDRMRVNNEFRKKGKAPTGALIYITRHLS
jgi:hypothetical protein